VDNASCVWSGRSFLLRKGYGLIDAVGGSAGSLIAWVGGGEDREEVDVIAGFGYEGY